MATQMESYVNCPVCGEHIQIILSFYEDSNGHMRGMEALVEKIVGIEKTDHFMGTGKCRCGKAICASIHVTAVSEEINDKR